ncbi:MAG: phage antirepressor KilAC domain-containing protein [Ruminococcus flavefaciens]|nr:phage antirepressor KilAC domain-containing protein [Ruminococcus flavefaciens]
MKNHVKIFNNSEFGSVRTIEENGRILFCGSDVARALGYNNSRQALIAHCKGVTKRDTLTNGGVQALSFIPEGDLYRLVVHSRLPSAEKFERWIFDEILPTIRKTGGYVNDEDLFVENYLPFADEPVKNLFRLQMKVINQLNDRIRHDKPLVEFANQVAESENFIDMNAMAKLAVADDIRIGRNRLFRWLRSKGILMSNNIPYQKYIDNGYFVVKETVVDVGMFTKTHQQTLVTGKGQLYIINRLKNEFGEAY